ncbi:hypothetical protein KSP40_PGU014632 [Platanthera guangdongensis]|uniref:Uncharacterized protein n=1 Tax=Platanthera guangdongensis TaxID=2320717 RepID=A0ABR2M8X9_9ASPA
MIENLFDERQTNNNSLTENSGKDKDKHGRGIRMNGGRAVRRPQISREEASRKKRSIAELILVADAELTVEEKIGTFEEEAGGLNQKKKKGGKERDEATDVEVIKSMNEEENGFTRRERKKSKYLSPPYTNAYREHRSNSFKTVDSEASENESENSMNLQTKFTDGDEEPRKEGDPVTHSSIYTEYSAHDILGKLLFAACNPLHKGRNTPVETVREFFVNHRNFAYSGILDLENLSKQPGGDSGTDEMVIEFNQASRRKRNNSKVESKLETVLALNRNREKVKKDQVTTETPMNDYCLNGVVSLHADYEIGGLEAQMKLVVKV